MLVMGACARACAHVRVCVHARVCVRACVPVEGRAHRGESAEDVRPDLCVQVGPELLERLAPDG